MRTRVLRAGRRRAEPARALQPDPHFGGGRGPAHSRAHPHPAVAGCAVLLQCFRCTYGRASAALAQPCCQPSAGSRGSASGRPSLHRRSHPCVHLPAAEGMGQVLRALDGQQQLVRPHLWALWQQGVTDPSNQRIYSSSVYILCHYICKLA